MSKLIAGLFPVALLCILLHLQPASGYYDPGVQRWVNRDPIKELGGRNLYLFAMNSPTIRSDGFGLDVFQFPTPEGPLPDLNPLQRAAMCANLENHMYALSEQLSQIASTGVDPPPELLSDFATTMALHSAICEGPPLGPLQPVYCPILPRDPPGLPVPPGQANRFPMVLPVPPVWPAVIEDIIEWLIIGGSAGGA